jgi:hypothetical protein
MKMQKPIKQENQILKNIKFVGVTFDPDSFKNGENELNKAIEMGYKVITDYPTSTGVVFSVGLYNLKEERE